MSCKCQCTNVFDYCEQDVCGDLDFGIAAQVPGAHKLVLDYLNNQITIQKEFAIGENISFPLSDLNENFQYLSELYDPVGSRILITKDGVEYDCFKFKTVINVVHDHIVTS